MNKLWLELKSNFAESALLRWCSLGIVLILLFELYFRLQDARWRAFEQMEDSRSLYFDNADIGNLENWQKNLGDVSELNSVLVKQLWDAKTEGEGRALVQKELNLMLEDLNSKNLRLRLGNAVKVSDSPVIWEVQFQINARVQVDRSLQLVHRISRKDPVMIIKDLRIDSLRNNQMLLIGSAFFSSDWS